VPGLWSVARNLPGLKPLGLGAVGAGATAALGWTALKVGALSFGGGFVIVPLMQSDAVRNHWLSHTDFGTAVALGQLTPGPVTHTVAVVGYAAEGRGLPGIGGGLLAAALAFAPSFLFVLAGARHHERIRGNQRVRAFLDGAGPAAIGAILGSAVPLALAISKPWQVVPLAFAAGWLLVLKRSVPTAIVVAGLIGAVAVALLALPASG
jgi:chromate transporter